MVLHFIPDRVVSKVAFIPPVDTTYVFNFELDESAEIYKWSKDCGELLLAQHANLSIRTKTLRARTQAKLISKNVECFYAFSSLSNRIVCMLIHSVGPKSKTDKVIVYSHPNAEGKQSITCCK